MWVFNVFWSQWTDHELRNKSFLYIILILPATSFVHALLWIWWSDAFAPACLCISFAFPLLSLCCFVILVMLCAFPLECFDSLVYPFVAALKAKILAADALLSSDMSDFQLPRWSRKWNISEHLRRVEKVCDKSQPHSDFTTSRVILNILFVICPICLTNFGSTHCTAGGISKPILNPSKLSKPKPCHCCTK